MEKILLLLETSSSLDKNLILTVIPTILAHSYSNHGEEGGRKDGLLMQAHTQQQQTTSQEVTWEDLTDADHRWKGLFTFSNSFYI